MNDQKSHHSGGVDPSLPMTRSEDSHPFGDAFSVPNEGSTEAKVNAAGISARLKAGGDACLGGSYNFISLIGHWGLLVSEKVMFFVRGGGEGRFRAARTGAALMLVLLFGLGITYFMMGYRALPANFLKDQIKLAMAENFDGATVEIGEVLLQRDTYNGGLFVRLTNMVLREKKGGILAASPETAIGLKFIPLLVGNVAPDSLSLIGPEVHLMRDEAGNWSFRRQNGRLPGDATGLPETPLSAESLAQLGEFVRSGLNGAHQQLQRSHNLSFIGIRQAKIILYNRERTEKEGGEVWLMPSFTLQYDQQDDKQLVGSGLLQPQSADTSEVWFAISHRQGDPFVDVKSRLQNIIPGQVVQFMPALSSLRAVKLGISGAFTGRIDFTEGLHAGALKVILSEGEIGIFGDKGPNFDVTRGAFEFAMEAGAKHISLERGTITFPSGEIALKGDIWRESLESGPGDWRFQLYSTEGQMYESEFLSPGARIDEFSFAGRLFASQIPVSIDEMRVKIGAASLLMAHDASQGFPVVLRGRFQDVPLALIKAAWPTDFMSANRDWVIERVKAGIISSGQFALKAGDDSQPYTKIAMATKFQRKQPAAVLPSVQFEVRDLAYTIFDDPLLIKSEGVRVVIRADQMNCFMKTGRLMVANPQTGTDEQIVLQDGRLLVPDIHREVPEGRYELKVESGVVTLVELLKREPFHYNSAINQQLTDLKGTVSGNIKIKAPLKDKVVPEEVQLGGALVLRDGEAGFQKFRMKSGLIKFELGQQTVEATGSILINGASTNISWRRQFQPPENSLSPPLKLRGVFDAADRNQLGLDVNDLIDGEVPLELSIRENTKGKFDVHVTADLSRAALAANALGWDKEAGKPARLEFDVVEEADKHTRLTNFHIDGDDVTARGEIRLNENYEVTGFSFPQLSYKVVSNISIAGQRNLDEAPGRRVWFIKANGAVFDGRGILRSLLQTGQVGSPGDKRGQKSDGIVLQASFDKVLGWHQTQLNDFDFVMKRQGDQLNAFNLKGTLAREGALTGKLVSRKGSDPVIEINTDNAGNALRFVGFYPNMLGGRGQLIVRYNVKKRQLASQTGRLIISRFSIASDPVVREVLANVGKGKKGQQLTAQAHIPFNRLVAPFSIGHRQFVLHDSYVKGDLLGATMRGQLDFQSNRVRLSGTYVPLYGLNAAVGAVPVLGDILVGRQGEGMLGITFGIYGDLNRPEVLVNPMSLVAPGVFRQIFEFEQNSPKIKVRPNNDAKGSIKLDSSASQVKRLKKGQTIDDLLPPETSASEVQRR